MNEARRPIGWQEANAGLARTRQVLDARAELPPDDVRRILRERAEALARPLEEAPAPTEVLELSVFSLAGERYGIETAHILEVVPLRGLTPVPCTPSVVLGVVNLRGRILPVLDLRRLFDLPGQGVTEENRIVAVEAGGMTFGLFADAVTGTVRLAANEMAPAPASRGELRETLVLGVTAGMVVVLDPEALARDPRITVNEEAG